MKLNLKNLGDKQFWSDKNIEIPSFDIEAVKRKTLDKPMWVHFGAGNIFRAFPAAMQQKLLNGGHSDRGILVVEAYDEEIVEKAFLPYDNLSIAATLPAAGDIKKSVVASVVHSMALSGNRNELSRIFTSASLQIASFTITEKGYALKGAGGIILPFIAADMDNPPDKANSAMGLAAALLYERYKAGKLPMTFLSMDNCTHNGDRIKEAVTAFARAWAEKGFVEPGFAGYIDDTSLVAFPLTMIDKITPSPSVIVKKALEADGLEGMDITVTAKRTVAAPFVNAEETQYFIVEDIFPNGRPPLEMAGTIFTDRATVDKVEKMKVCTCLNPLHTILAVFGLLLNYKTIAEEMKDELLVKFIRRAGFDEGMPVVINPGIIDPGAFIDEVITKRFPNPFVPDTPNRIASDTSAKIPVRFGETLKAYIARGDAVDSLTYIPLFAAGWLRYLTGINDSGEPFEISPDPMLETLKGHVGGIKLGDSGIGDKVKPILSDKSIFGVDLYEHGLGEKVENYLIMMLEGPGAVRRTLENVMR